MKFNKRVILTSDRLLLIELLLRLVTKPARVVLVTSSAFLTLRGLRSILAAADVYVRLQSGSLSRLFVEFII
jgi:hypothetical protein